jgi:hypothetical protein
MRGGEQVRRVDITKTTFQVAAATSQFMIPTGDSVQAVLALVRVREITADYPKDIKARVFGRRS